MKCFARKSLQLLGNCIDGVVTSRAGWIKESRLTPFVPLVQLLFLALACGLAPGFASADQTQGTITIMDLTEGPITARVQGGTNQVDQTITADKDSPEKLSFSIPVDGTVVAGSGVAVLLESNGTVSDLLEVTVTPKKRGMNIPFFDASGTFTSDIDPGGLDLTGLGLSDEIMKKVLANGLAEDGTQQDIGSRLIDPTTGNALNIGGLVITAASDVPEPSSLLLFGTGLLALAVLSQRRHECVGPAMWVRFKRKSGSIPSFRPSARKILLTPSFPKRLP